jgi:iron complex outermembrane receptor protein
MALFGETTWTVWSKLELTLGLRAYRTTLDGVIDSSGPLTAADTAQSGNTKNTRVGKITEQGLNPKLTANYFFSDTLSVYASVARGFRFGGMNFIGSNATTEVPDTYKSDTLWSYETGLRSQWLEKTLVVDVTPFYSTWEDPQLYQNDNTGNTVNWRENVGGVRSYGVEFALQYLPPIDGLNLSFAAAWITAETTEAFTTNAGTEAEPGTPWPQTAEYQTATTLSYTRGLFGNWAGNASLVHAYLSEASSNLDNFATIFGYQTLDLQLGLFNPSMRGAPSLSLNLSNLTDERGVGGAAVSRSDLVDRTYIRPRTLTLRLGVDF